MEHLKFELCDDELYDILIKITMIYNYVFIIHNFILEECGFNKSKKM